MTPCTWLAAVGTVEGVSSPLDGDLLGNDPAAAYAASAAAAVFRRPGDTRRAMRGVIRLGTGHRFLDVRSKAGTSRSRPGRTALWIRN